MSGSAYTWQRIYSAVRSLVISSGSLDERLQMAWRYNLQMLDVNDLPSADLKNEFDLIRRHFEERPSDADYEPDPAQLKIIAGKIVDLYDAICRGYFAERAAGQ